MIGSFVYKLLYWTHFGVLKSDGLNMKVNQEPGLCGEQMYSIMQKSTLLIHVGTDVWKVKSSYRKNGTGTGQMIQGEFLKLELPAQYPGLAGALKASSQNSKHR